MKSGACEALFDAILGAPSQARTPKAGTLAACFRLERGAGRRTVRSKSTARSSNGGSQDAP